MSFYQGVHMSDSRKTKSELIAELIDLRKNIEALKNHCKHVGGKNMAPAKAASKTRDNRKPIKADIEFIGVFDLLKAKAVNVSEGGISLKISDNLPFEMHYTINGKTVIRTAHLIWLKHTENGGYNFGFKFVNEKLLPEF